MQDDLENLSNIDVQQLIQDYVLPWGINIVMALAIFIIGKMVIGVLVNVAKSIMVKAKMDSILVNFITSIVRTILLLFVVIAALNELGVDTTSLIALIGAAGLAIGLALQGTLQNLASGVMLIIFRPFTDGDFIEAAGVTGVVEEIGIFTTTIKTKDNRELIIPNGALFGDTISNYSSMPTRRVDMVFGIGYSDDLLKAKAVMLNVLESNEMVLADPSPSVGVCELADSSVNFNVRPWCKSDDYWTVYSDIHEAMKLALDAEGISIPFPQMDIHQDKAA